MIYLQYTVDFKTKLHTLRIRVNELDLDKNKNTISCHVQFYFEFSSIQNTLISVLLKGFHSRMHY